MGFLLGIDGGGTGCRAAVADLSGRILGMGAAGPANIASDPEGARANILSASKAALAAASMPDDLSRLRAGLGLAGANAAGAADWLAARLPFGRIKLDTDAVTATRGALGAEDGIVAAIGTGSVFTLQLRGRIQSLGGWGLVLGDEGSGAWLGRLALARALRAADGLEPQTPFLAQLLARMGGAAGIVRFASAASAADFAALAPELMENDDPAAQGICAAGEAEIGRVLQHLRKKAELPVTFIGGLGPSYSHRFADLPQRKAKGTPLDGALMLALEAA